MTGFRSLSKLGKFLSEICPTRQMKKCLKRTFCSLARLSTASSLKTLKPNSQRASDLSHLRGARRSMTSWQTDPTRWLDVCSSQKERFRATSHVIPPPPSPPPSVTWVRLATYARRRFEPTSRSLVRSTRSTFNRLKMRRLSLLPITIPSTESSRKSIPYVVDRSKCEKL